MMNIKLFEEFEENELNISPEKISFMDKLNDSIKSEIMPKINKKFKVNYERGENISIRTDNDLDLSIIIKFLDTKVSFYSKPTVGPEFEFEFDFNNKDLNTILKLIKNVFKDDPNDGIHRKYNNKDDQYVFDTDEPSSNISVEDMDIDTPITKKPIRRKRSININIIKNVLEDAYIMDDINLSVSVEELIRRMLLEDRK